LVAGWGDLIFVYIGDRQWRRYNFVGSCRTVKEVEFLEEMKRERETR